MQTVTVVCLWVCLFHHKIHKILVIDFILLSLLSWSIVVNVVGQNCKRTGMLRLIWIKRSWTLSSITRHLWMCTPKYAPKIQTVNLFGNEYFHIRNYIYVIYIPSSQFMTYQTIDSTHNVTDVVLVAVVNRQLRSRIQIHTLYSKRLSFILKSHLNLFHR